MRAQFMTWIIYGDLPWLLSLKIGKIQKKIAKKKGDWAPDPCKFENFGIF